MSLKETIVDGLERALAVGIRDGRRQALEEAAALIETMQEASSFGGEPAKLVPRGRHDVAGLAYAAAIRALLDKEG